MRPVKVLTMILAGGIGERLYPLTGPRSKPAVHFGGNFRIIDFTLSNCINSEITRVFVLTQFNSASLNRHISRTYNFGLFTDDGVEIQMEADLFGAAGHRQIVTNALGRQVPADPSDLSQFLPADVTPEPGKNIYLSIDLCDLLILGKRRSLSQFVEIYLFRGVSTS